MHAMALKQLGGPLEWTELPDRQPGPGQIRIQVAIVAAAHILAQIERALACR